jgi:hypothetical protein
LSYRGKPSWRLREGLLKLAEPLLKHKGFENLKFNDKGS